MDNDNLRPLHGVQLFPVDLASRVVPWGKETKLINPNKASANFKRYLKESVLWGDSNGLLNIANNYNLLSGNHIKALNSLEF